ncbi:MAG: GDP-mannose 4,6-dehydratase [Nitrososphaerota archaeon]|nr:GDP-mannose 4,6-dehydratase [Candidatus Calditenuis fumarioli]
MLVTGGLGFIGSHLVERLIGLGEDVVALGHPRLGENYLDDLLRAKGEGRLIALLLDLNDLNAVKTVLERFKPEVVFHLAALASHRLSVEQPHLFIDNNVRTTLNVLEAARTTEPSPRVVFASSSSVYGDHQPPLREEMPPRPKGPYALSKWIGEELCKEYVRSYGLEVVTVRYFNVVGERCRSNIVFKVFADRIASGQPVDVNGRTVDGVFRPAERDFTYVGDVVEGTILAAERGRPGEIYNLGRGEPQSVLRLAELMMELMDRRVEVRRRELAPHEALVSYSDSSKAQRELGWRPRVGFEETVRRYVDWYLARR